LIDANDYKSSIQQNGPQSQNYRVPSQRF